MRSIMLLNAKGGCGKSTLATNLASYYASQNKVVSLVDFDPQGSSMAWLKARPQNRPPIHGIAAWEQDVRLARDTDIAILDAPARVVPRELAGFVRRADTLLIPVLPSPMDIRAGTRFIHDLLLQGKVSRKQTRVAVVANRIRENTLSFQTLYAFLDSLKIPFIATLRDTQNYIRAAERGVGIFEMAPSQVEPDLEEWGPLLDWLHSRASRPVA